MCKPRRPAGVFQKELFRVLYLALQLHQLEFRLPNVLACLVVKREQIQINVGVIDQLVTKYNETLNKMDRPVVSKRDPRVDGVVYRENRRSCIRFEFVVRFTPDDERPGT